MGVALLACATPKSAVNVPTSITLEPVALELDRTPARGGATPAPLLRAMRTELDRSFAELKSHGDPAPYFMAYEAVDGRAVVVAAEFGALLQSDDVRTRDLDVDVRVGDPKLDNTHALRDKGAFSPHRSGAATAIPVEDDPDALRAAMWLATDQRYKDAAERLVKVKSERALNVADDDASDDFSADPPGTLVEAPATLELDRRAWEERVKGLSGAFRLHPDLEGKVELAVSAQTHYLASSEGASLQRSATHVRLIFTVQTTARDGMNLHLQDTVDATSVAKLPDQATLQARVHALIDQIEDLRTAPVAEPYVGPAILDGRAASVFFHETFGHRVEGHRQKDDQEGQTFARKIGERIMPDFINVWDDPTVRTLNGTELNGYYPFDNEGTLARRVSLVENGVLKGFLMSRAPARGFNHSNGHGRRASGQDVVARQANLVVDPTREHTTQDLKNMLLAEVKRQGKPYGLRFADVEGGYTTTARADIQAFRVRPVVVYRVFPDGREELVRGVDLEGTPLTSLSTILAAGNDVAVFNGFCGAESGWVPVSAASPSLLVGQMEVAHKNKGYDKPPILPPPGALPAPKGGAK
jgi:predicted Zn-dependent protease